MGITDRLVDLVFECFNFSNKRQDYQVRVKSGKEFVRFERGNEIGILEGGIMN